MPKEFDENGVKFMYPENWRLDKHPPAEGLACALSLEAPSGALWTLNVEEGLRDPQGVVDSVRQTLSEEYEGAESEPLAGSWGEQATCGCEMHFYVLELVAKAVIESLQHKGRTYLVMTQAEIRDHEQLTPVFQALCASLVGQARPA